MKLDFVSEAAAPEDRYACKRVELPANGRITRPEDLVLIIREFLCRKRQEYFLAGTLDGAGNIISIRIVTIGILNHSLVHPREVFRDAILDSCASIIVAHNHPSGSLDPSSQDIAITKQLSQAAAILGISITDHIIIAKTGHYSFREHGLI